MIITLRFSWTTNAPPAGMPASATPAQWCDARESYLDQPGASMCGRYALHTPASFIAKTYWNHQMPVGDLVARYNIAPGSQILSVRLVEPDQPSFDLAYWGFKPAWAGEGAPKPINARIESLNSRYFRAHQVRAISYGSFIKINYFSFKREVTF